MKSTFSNPGGNCLDVTRVQLGPGNIQLAIRNTRQQDGPVVYCTRQEWEAFLMGAAGYQFEWEKIPFEGEPVREATEIPAQS